MKILVTGGAGFIGSHIAEALVARGDEVLVVDNLSTGHRHNIPAGAEFAQVDITSPEVEQVIVDFAPEAIFHEAAQVDVRVSVADPARDATTNVVGTVRVVASAARAQCKTIVFASSGGAIYGEQEAFPADEEHPTRSVSPYGLAKLCGELYLGLYSRAAGMRAVALRYANVYGPRQDPHGEAGVVAIFCNKLKEKQSLTIFGDGGQTRDFVYVGDVARANLLALDTLTARGSYNIGTGVETDINRLSKILQDVSSVKVDVQHLPGKPGEQRRSVLATARAHKELGWQPQMILGEGLKATYGFFAKQHN